MTADNFIFYTKPISGNMGDRFNNEINGGRGDDTMYGEQGRDIMNGDAGDDEMYGGEDKDTLNGGEGDDWLDGGPGDDTSYSNRATATMSLWTLRRVTRSF